ncbi:DUF5605 domain-containing protein [Nonomuraea sp. 10N515B]|uniref:DUF5605 domain-containing protein n=1 Tax=Nonomuraea sp. 10N515B TaxID=3457422 RepID=UPI003FCC779A
MSGPTKATSTKDGASEELWWSKGGELVGSSPDRIAYFGFDRPSSRDITMEPGTVWTVDVIDTWNMTVETLPGTYSGSFRVPLPARSYMALRLVAADPSGASSRS